MKSDAKFEEKLTLSFKNDKKNLVNFHSKSFTSMGYLSQVYGLFVPSIWGLS